MNDDLLMSIPRRYFGPIALFVADSVYPYCVSTSEDSLATCHPSGIGPRFDFTIFVHWWPGKRRFMNHSRYNPCAISSRIAMRRLLFSIRSSYAERMEAMRSWVDIGGRGT